MARRERNYRAEYEARKARANLKGFTSPKTEGKARRSVGAQRNESFSADDVARIRKLTAEARRTTREFQNSDGAFAFREDKAKNLEYLEKYHRWVLMRQDDSGSAKTKAERKAVVLALMAEQYDLDADSVEEYYDGDGGSVPE